jgi:hypothetical protein
MKQLKSYNCCNLLSKQYICIQSNLITGNINNSSDSESNILVSIPVLQNPYSLIVYNNIGNFKTNLYSNTLSYVNLKIVDQNNNLLNLNGCNWSCTLQLDVVNFVE